MKRSLALATSFSLVLIVGCGTANYNQRLARTLDNMKYQMRLDEFLNPPAEGKLKELLIHLRPPKPLEATREFQLSSAEGQHDAEVSFQPKDPGLRLHVIARRKQAKAPTAKGKAAAPAVERQPFRFVVNELMKVDFSTTDEALAKGTEVREKSNSFKRINFFAPLTQNNVQLYLYENKAQNYDVALVFDVPSNLSKDAKSTEGIKLCLQSFAVGPKAERLFAGGTDDEEQPVVGGGEGGEAPPVAF